jgi:uncharacterized membrane protein YcaP (DUF421 family)
MLFEGWEPIARTLLLGAVAYIAVVALIRLSGKRTVSKMNAFDLIVTVALGSTLATILLSPDVALLQGVAALALLIALQRVVTFLTVRYGWARRLVKAKPTMVFHRGEFLRGAMRDTRLTEDELLSAMRSQGVAAIEDVEAVVLETDGGISVLRPPESGRASALRDVENPPPPA